MFKKITYFIVRIPIVLRDIGASRLALLLQYFLLLLGKNLVRERVFHSIKSVDWLYKMQKKSKMHSHSLDYPIYLINRDKDKHRLNAFKQRSKKFEIPFIRIDALDFSNKNLDFNKYKVEIGTSYYGRKSFLRGDVGCFLSHRQAWQQLLNDHYEVGLICEDDAKWLGPIPARIADYGIPSDADFIFTNQRMAEGLHQQFYTDQYRDKTFIYIPTSVAISKKLQVDPYITGPGGDGYFLTRKGAEKLMDIHAKIKTSMSVDWFLFFYSLNDQEMSSFLAIDPTDRFDAIKLIPDRLISYVMLPDLVEQSSMGSGIQVERPENYLEYSKVFPGSN